ncbi:hypothetical protein GGS20DRAFT_526860 [Poronia punctata]|nr:hypothetical protein GGS20DRAFT_526860 [Poronia punctata]
MDGLCFARRLQIAMKYANLPNGKGHDSIHRCAGLEGMISRNQRFYTCHLQCPSCRPYSHLQPSILSSPTWKLHKAGDFRIYSSGETPLTIPNIINNENPDKSGVDMTSQYLRTPLDSTLRHCNCMPTSRGISELPSRSTKQKNEMTPAQNAGTRPHEGDMDDLISILVRERLGYASFLERLGFSYNTSISILRYWVTLGLKAPAGGPYDLFGTALAVIAELDEPRYDPGMKCDEQSMASKRDWLLAFAPILNDRALSSLRRARVHQAETFTQAKWVVYRMMVGWWEWAMASGPSSSHWR